MIWKPCDSLKKLDTLKYNFLFYFLVDAKDLEKAASLAEKYLDFQSMIEICEKTGNSDKFDYYKTKFEEQVIKFIVSSSKLILNASLDYIEK